MLPTPFPAGIDFRSAAVLARKEEIELVSPGRPWVSTWGSGTGCRVGGLT